MSSSTTPTAGSLQVYPRDGALIGRISAKLAAWAAIVAGVLSFVIGVLQFLFPQDEDPAIDPRTRFILVMFTLSLWAFAVFFLGLARYARSTWGAVVASVGTVLLTVGTITSAVNGIDLEFFPYVAVVANGLWFVGAIVLAISLVRARQVPLWVAILLPLVQLPLLVLSQRGGGVLAGVYLVAVAATLFAGRIQARARKLEG